MTDDAQPKAAQAMSKLLDKAILRKLADIINGEGKLSITAAEINAINARLKADGVASDLSHDPEAQEIIRLMEEADLIDKETKQALGMGLPPLSAEDAYKQKAG